MLGDVQAGNRTDLPLMWAGEGIANLRRVSTEAVGSFILLHVAHKLQCPWLAPPLLARPDRSGAIPEFGLDTFRHKQSVGLAISQSRTRRCSVQSARC